MMKPIFNIGKKIDLFYFKVLIYNIFIIKYYISNINMKKTIVITRKTKNTIVENTIVENTSSYNENVNASLDIKNLTHDTHDLNDIETFESKYKLFKLKLDKSILLVDTSYWVYYRFFALRNWYVKAHPDINTTDNYNWLEDKEFMTKYEKLFLESIYNITLKYNIPISNIVFCIDCPYKEIWRYELKTDYKGTRIDSHKKNNFNSFEIFNVVKDTIIPKLQAKYKMSAIIAGKCEADDIVGNLAPFLENKLKTTSGTSDTSGTSVASIVNNNIVESAPSINETIENEEIMKNDSGDETQTDLIPKIYILASDNDYIQICNYNIILIDGNGKILCTEKKAKGGFQYLIRKILSGDVSDNIEPCFIKSNFIVKDLPKTKAAREKAKLEANDYKKCTPSIIDKLVIDDSTYDYFVKYLENLRNNKMSGGGKTCEYVKDNQFAKNATLIDFQMLPDYLKKILLSKFNQLV